MAEHETGQRRGRPPKAPGERRRFNQVFRTRESLRDKLQSAADFNQRSVSEEVEQRLESSFEQQKIIEQFEELLIHSMFGSRDIARYMQALSSCILMTQLETGKEFLRDDRTKAIALKCMMINISKYLSEIRRFEDIDADIRKIIPGPIAIPDEVGLSRFFGGPVDVGRWAEAAMSSNNQRHESTKDDKITK